MCAHARVYSHQLKVAVAQNFLVIQNQPEKPKQRFQSVRALSDCVSAEIRHEGLRYLALVLSQPDPWSFGLTSFPKVAGVRSYSSQRPLRRMLTDRLLAHMRMQVSSPSCRKMEYTVMKQQVQAPSWFHNSGSASISFGPSHPDSNMRFSSSNSKSALQLLVRYSCRL